MAEQHPHHKYDDAPGKAKDRKGMASDKPSPEIQAAQKKSLEAARKAKDADEKRQKAEESRLSPADLAARKAANEANQAHGEASSAAVEAQDAAAREALGLKLGREIDDDEWVFHINGNKSDNKWENIEVRSAEIEEQEKKLGRHLTEGEQLLMEAKRKK